MLPLPLLPAALAGLALSAPPPVVQVVEGERMRAPRSAAVVGAPGGRALALAGAGRARARVVVAAPSELRLLVRPRPCAGAPELRVAVDGRRVLARRPRRAHLANRGGCRDDSRRAARR